MFWLIVVLVLFIVSWGIWKYLNSESSIDPLLDSMISNPEAFTVSQYLITYHRENLPVINIWVANGFSSYGWSGSSCGLKDFGLREKYKFSKVYSQWTKLKINDN